MYSIIVGTIILGFIHALIPNHWLPLVLIAKAESWKKSELLLVATLTSAAHVLGTVILGIILGILGSKLAHQYQDYVHVALPILLILFGLIYFTIHLPHRAKAIKEAVPATNKARTKWIIGFVLIMFFSPCIEVESLFLAAGAFGLNNILLLALVYAIISITGIVTLVMLVSKGVHLINSRFVEQNEKRITGIVLIIVGVITFYVH